MPAASDTLKPAPAAASEQRQEPVLHPAATSPSPLPASIAGAFAAAAYSLQQELQNDAPAEEEDGGLLPQLYASRIGPRSRDYYLAQFKRFDALDRGLPSWNMAAAFFTLAWCCWRGLWREAAKYLASATALALLWWFGLRPALPEAFALGLGAALWLVTLAVPGLLGNSWYWRQTRAQTLKAIAAAPNMAQAHAALQAQALPTQNKIATLLVLALPLAAAAGAGLALLPARDAAPQPARMPAATAKPASIPIAAAAPAATPTAAPAAKAEPAPQASAPAEPAASEPSPAVPEAKPAAPRSELEPGKFYLNVGVFADPANAGRALAQLEKSGLPVLTQTLPSNKGEATRVRSGPFDSRKRAEKAARKLQALDLDASIFQAAELASKK